MHDTAGMLAQQVAWHLAGHLCEFVIDMCACGCAGKLTQQVAWLAGEKRHR